MIIIYLHPNSTLVSWIEMDTFGILIQAKEGCELSELSISPESDIYVVVPMQDILLTSVQLPKLSKQRLMQALPFALEEQLIDDVSELHFAIADYQADGSIPVAVTSKQKMSAWLQQLEEFNITPRAFIPAVFLLPYANEHSWQINHGKNNCMVRTGKMSGFSCEENNIETLLSLNLAEYPEKESIQLIHTHESEQQLLKKASTIEKLSFINLLQNTYQAKPKSTQIKKNWLIAAYLVIAWVSLAFASNVVSFFILYYRTSHIETQINQIYKHNFPQSNSMVAPRERMTEKLRSLSGKANQNFFILLGELGNSLSKTPDVRIKSFDFREKQLTLGITATSFDSIDKLIQNLKQKKLSVKQQNAAETGSQVTATLIIRAGGAL